MSTKIEWAEETWNPITGCDPISEGCANCYARRMATRLRGRYGYPADDPFRVTFHPERLGQPERWKKPRMIFVCSMGDLFHERVSIDHGCMVLGAAKEAPQHKYLFLTKRPEIMLKAMAFFCGGEPMPSNWWLGVSAENQQRAEERIPILLQIPAAVRFVSCEPLLGPMDLDIYFSEYDYRPTYDYFRTMYPDIENKPILIRPGIDWVICGGEAGPGARPMHPDWARSLRDQCVDAGVPFFFKQWGQYCYPDQMPEVTYNAIDVHHNLAGHGDYNKPWGVGKKLAGRLLDGREWNEFPIETMGSKCPGA